MVFGDEFVSLIMELFSYVPNNGLTVSENVLFVNESWDTSIPARNCTESFGVRVFEGLRLIHEILLNEIELELFLSDGNVGLSGVGTHFVREQCQLAHG